MLLVNDSMCLVLLYSETTKGNLVKVKNIVYILDQHIGYFLFHERSSGQKLLFLLYYLFISYIIIYL